MLKSAFRLGEELHLRKVEYPLHSQHWLKFNLGSLGLSFNKWTTIKYLDSEGKEFHEDIEKVPNDKGGLYIFFVKCPIIPGLTEFPLYIGRAQLTTNQNLRKRCKEYHQRFALENERPQITRMMEYWASDLYLSFLVLDENPQIQDFEKKLINSLLLPFNDEIPDQEVRQATKAF